MKRSKLLAAVLLCSAASPLLAAPAAAQGPAQARLFTRTAGGVVRAAIEIELEGRWHIYHEELGHPKAVGQPTSVTFHGEGIEWSPVRFPEPIRLDQSDVAGEGVFILAHEHRLVLHAAGRLAPGATTEGLEVKVKGLVCEDVQGCIPFRQTLTSEGAGDDALFAAFPADLQAPPAATSEAEGSEAPVVLLEAAESPANDAGASPPAGAEQEDVLEGEHVDATLYTRVEGGETRAAIEFVIDPGWHLYHTADDLGQDPTGKPTRITLRGGGVSWEEPRFPAPVRLDQSAITPGAYINAHEGTIVVHARGTPAPGAESGTISAEIEGQVCDPSFCINYTETAYSRGSGPESVWKDWSARHAASRGSNGAAPASEPDSEKEGLLLFLLLAIGGGLFALVMPCTYPMIPITISFFTKQAEKRGGTPLSLSLAYGAGIVLLFVVIGVLFGSLIRPFASHPVTNLVLGVAFVYFALVLFGALNLEPPRFLMNVAGAASSKGGYLGVFLMGATLVVTSFTCTAPFVGTLLSIGASGGDAGRVALGMTVFGLTMAVPFVLLSLVPGRLKAMPRSGEWMNTVKITLGFVELAAALKFFSNTDLVWHWGWLSRDLFLTLWMGIFGVAALYLFGLIRVKTQQSEISPARLVVGLVFALFALYCGNGAAGSTMDAVMTAIIPNYSTRPLGGGAEVRKHAIVVDDYEQARARARAQGKLVLLNFTGYT